MSNTKNKRKINELLSLAQSLGASEVSVISPIDVCVEDELATLCSKTTCDFYGLAPSCPPHVSGPAGMREMLGKSDWVLVVKIVLPSSVLFSTQRREVMQVLHELVAGVETAALGKGYAKARGFAGGSCKELFCSGYESCQFLTKSSCRNIEKARVSMSGYGVNVGKMLEAACLEIEEDNRGDDSLGEKMSWIAGMILLKE